MVTTTFFRYASIALFTAVFFILPMHAHAATITAQTDRSTIAIDESFDLTFTADGNIDKAADFSPLKKDFDILNQSQGSNVSIINGNFSKTTMYTLTLMPKRAGNLTIPAIFFGKDKSQPLALSVGAAATASDPAAADQAADLIVEITPSRTTTWVQGQIILTVKLFSAVNLRQYGISKIDTGKFDVAIESLGDAKQYQTTQGNRNFLAIEQKFALYPQQAGQLTIEPVLAEVEAVVQSRSYFDPFNMRTKTLHARSKAININVLNIAEQFTGKTWLPATDVQLVEDWSPNPPVFKVGEPVTRTLNVFADGLTAAQLPPLMGADIDGIKQYPDQPVLNNDKNSSGIIGGRREKIALIPTRSGSFILPAVEIMWWNSKTGTTEIARLAERTIQVLPGNPGSQNSHTPDEQFPALENTDADATLVAATSPQPALWIGLSIFLAAGWLFTGLAWWRYSRRATHPKPDTKNKPVPVDASKAAIKLACHHGNANACKDALINWAKHALSADINNLGDINTYLLNQHNANSQLLNEINQLNTALYSAHASAWHGESLWQQLQTIQTAKIKLEKHSEASLEPLYK